MLFPYSVFDTFWLAPVALCMDLCFGDPALPWKHPVVGIGNMLNALEALARPCLAKTRNPQTELLLGRLLGLAALLVLLTLVGTLVWLAVSLTLVGTLFAVYFAWAGLAMGSLLSTGRVVLHAVEDEPLEQARSKLSWLVSRETSSMDRPCMRKTLADTLSENFTDALCAPFFWLLLFGPVGLWVYKAASTTDSMWGYTTPAWKALGWAGARCDDILAFVPARISIVCVLAYDALISTFFPKRKRWTGKLPSFARLHAQAIGMPSPNSGCSMNAFAWLCNASMAGPSVYFGVRVDKPWLGPVAEKPLPWNKDLLETLLFCMRDVSIVGMLLLWGFLVLVSAVL